MGSGRPSQTDFKRPPSSWPAPTGFKTAHSSCPAPIRFRGTKPGVVAV